jgi:hypothetical protein
MDVTEAVVRSGASKPSTMDIGEELIQPVRDAVAFGADLLIGYPPGAPEFQGGTGVVLALMESSDEAIFLTPCTRDNATATLINVAKDYGGSVVEFVRRVVDPSSPEAAFLADATAPPTTLPWEERDPKRYMTSWSRSRCWWSSLLPGTTSPRRSASRSASPGARDASPPAPIRQST